MSARSTFAPAQSDVTVPKRRKIGRWVLMSGALLAIPSWSLWLKVAAVNHHVWTLQSLLFAIPYVLVLGSAAINFLRPVAFGIATPLCWYGVFSASLFAAMGVLTLEKTFLATVVVVPAHLLMTIGLLLLLKRPSAVDLGQWFIGIVAVLAYAQSLLSMLGVERGRHPYPPIHGL